MIKRHTFLLALLTAVFTAFTLGFFVGRNYNHTPVLLSGVYATEAADEDNSRLILQAAATQHIETASTTQITQQTGAPVPSSDEPSEPATQAATEAPAPRETSPAVQQTTPKETTAATTEATKPSTEPTTITSTAAPTAPPTEAPTEAPTPQETSPSSSGLININTASVAQLMTLPGIGEVLAQRIVEYREANGPFQSVAALTNVKGIGEKRLAAIIDLVTI